MAATAGGQRGSGTGEAEAGAEGLPTSPAARDSSMGASAACGADATGETGSEVADSSALPSAGDRAGASGCDGSGVVGADAESARGDEPATAGASVAGFCERGGGPAALAARVSHGAARS
jgi:hypothetical protein